VAAAGDFLPTGSDAVLPFAGGFVGRFAVFQEQQLAAGFEYPFHLFQRCMPVGDGAQGEGEQHGVDGFVRQGYLLAGQAQPFHGYR